MCKSLEMWVRPILSQFEMAFSQLPSVGMKRGHWSWNFKLIKFKTRWLKEENSEIWIEMKLPSIGFKANNRENAIFWIKLKTFKYRFFLDLAVSQHRRIFLLSSLDNHWRAKKWLDLSSSLSSETLLLLHFNSNLELSELVLVPFWVRAL